MSRGNERYLLDTNVISEVHKGSRCNPHVAKWFDRISDDSLFLSVLILGEIRKGVERARVNEPEKARLLEKWLLEVNRMFVGRILTIDRTVVDEWGAMAAKRPVSVVDSLLAATAKVHDLTLVTRNVSDVEDLGGRVFNPFDAKR